MGGSRRIHFRRSGWFDGIHVDGIFWVLGFGFWVLGFGFYGMDLSCAAHMTGEWGWMGMDNITTKDVPRFGGVHEKLILQPA
jgi:hypothetical protein